MNNKFIFGMIGATIAGVVIGMLVAPETGADLRKKIQDNATNWGHKLVDLLGSIKEDGEAVVNKTEDAMKTAGAE